MKKREMEMLLIVFGILALVLTWQFPYKNFKAETEEVEAENAKLQETVDRLMILEAKKPEYLESIDLMKEADDEVISRFDSGVLREDEIMYLYNMELVRSNEVALPNISMSAAQSVPYEGALTTEDGYELVDDGIGMYRLDSTVNLKTTYNGLKNVLNYIYGLDSRKSVSAVNLTAGRDGYLSGNIQMSFYYLTGTGMPYAESDIPGVRIGTGNFFGVLNGGQYGDNGFGNAAEGEEASEDESGPEDEDSAENEADAEENE